MSPAPAPGWSAFWGLYETGEWEADTKAWLQNLQPGDLFVDIGAWIGPVTMWALEREATVIAIEPDPIAATMLHVNAPDAEIWEAAVTLRDEFTHLEVHSGDSTSCLAPQGHRVQGLTLATILEGRVPKMLKMDVEGYETTLAPAIVPWLAQNDVALQISLHGEILPRELFDDYAYVDWPEGTWGEVWAYNDFAKFTPKSSKCR